MHDTVYNDNVESFLNLCSILSSTKPALVTRAGGGESTVTELVMRKRDNQTFSGIDKELRKQLSKLACLSGILITNNHSLDVFVDSNLSAYSDSDAILIWDGTLGKQFDYCLNHLKLENPKLNLLSALALEPYYFFNVPSYKNVIPYKNKTILVISSHTASMKHQVTSGNYMRCFAPHRIFDDCRFKLVTPPQTLAGNDGGRDWQLNLPKFIEDIKAVGDFDIALVSCGGYGTPVVDYIHKKFHRHAVYVGGALQLFFGIMGERWKKNETIESFRQNNPSSWIFPFSQDIPCNAGRVEGGCYW